MNRGTTVTYGRLTIKSKEEASGNDWTRKNATQKESTRGKKKLLSERVKRVLHKSFTALGAKSQDEAKIGVPRLLAKGGRGRYSGGKLFTPPKDFHVRTRRGKK